MSGPISDEHRAPASQVLERVGLCALVAAFGAGFTGAAPTGTGWWDVILSIGLAVLFVVAGSRSSRTVLIASAGLAATMVGVGPWLGIAAAGFLAALASDFRPRQRVELQALAAALTFLALLHLRPIGFFGLSALLAAIAMVAVLASGYQQFNVVIQRRVKRALTACGLVVGGALILAALLGLSVRSSVTSGVDAARAGLDAARAGDTTMLNEQLERAQSQLQQASDKINSPLLKPIALIPVAAQHLQAASVAAEQGAVVARDAAATLSDVDIDSLRLRQGQFDLELLSSLAPRVTATAVRLEQAALAIEAEQSPWLLPIVDDQLQDLVDEITRVLPEARVAAEAAEIVPGLLGVDGEQRYLMLFGSPGESREFGGFVGGYALVGIEKGALDLIASGSINDLVFSPSKDALDDPSSYPVEYAAVDPGVFPQNLTSTPNIGLLARAVRDVFPELHGRPIDGVMYIDPYALAAMTEFTGPLVAQGIDTPLDRDGLVDFMFRGQYSAFDDRVDRFGAMGALAAATARGFENADLPGPQRLGQVLGPLARAGRLQVVTYDDQENHFLASVKLQRNFAVPIGADSFAVLQANATASKLDLYLQRDIFYDLNLDANGIVSGTVEVQLTSTIPEDAPPLTFGETDGTNMVLLSLYTGHELTGVTVDGDEHGYVTHNEFGFFRHALFKVPVPANAMVVVRFAVQGTTAFDGYRVGLWHQPLVRNDIVEVTVREHGQEPIVASREMTETWLFDPADP